VRRDFGARQVVTGRTHEGTEGLAVSVELWEAGAGHAQRGWRFLGQTNALLELERQIVQAVSRELGLGPTAAQQSAIDSLLTRNVEAWRHLKQGLVGQPSGTSAELAAAIQACYRALEVDPNCLDARTSLITAYRGLSSDRPAREVWPQVCDLARRALEIDDTSYWARYWLAGSKLQHYFLWEEAAREVEKPLPLEDHLSRAHFYRILGRLTVARLEQDKLESDRPRLEQMNLENPAVSFHSLQALFVERRYADGIREARRWTAVQPQSLGSYWPLTRLATESGDYATALAAVRNLRRVDDTPACLALEGRCLALMGERDKAIEVVDQLEAQSRTRYVNPYWVAWVHAGLRDRAKALECLERAVEDRAEEIVNVDWGGLRTDPAWDDLREEPRFQALLKQVGLDAWPK
jgi:tetratricopeptide (TPR) repeat protein